MEEKSLRKRGNWVLLYGIFVGILGFIVGFGCALGIGYTYDASGAFVKVTIQVFTFLIGWGWLLGSVLLIIGGAGLIYNKTWGKRISIIGVWFAFALAWCTIGIGFIFAMPPPRWRFDDANFIFFAVIGSVILFIAIIILKKLKKI